MCQKYATLHLLFAQLISGFVFYSFHLNSLLMCHKYVIVVQILKAYKVAIIRHSNN